MMLLLLLVVVVGAQAGDRCFHEQPEVDRKVFYYNGQPSKLNILVGEGRESRYLPEWAEKAH